MLILLKNPANWNYDVGMALFVACIYGLKVDMTVWLEGNEILSTCIIIETEIMQFISPSLV